MDLDITRAVADSELVSKIKDDKVFFILNSLMNNNVLYYDDLCTLRGLIETKNTKFNEQELKWILVNHKFLLGIIKGRKNRKNGREIFLELCKGSFNGLELARRLNINRKTAYRWMTLLEQRLMLKPNPFVYNYHAGDKKNIERLLIMNRFDYPLLIQVIKLLVIQQILNERKQFTTSKLQ